MLVNTLPQKHVKTELKICVKFLPPLSTIETIGRSYCAVLLARLLLL